MEKAKVRPLGRSAELAKAAWTHLEDILLSCELVGLPS